MKLHNCLRGLIFYFLIGFLVLITSCSDNTILLNQTVEFKPKWEFKQAKDSKWYPANVPGVVHLDLMHNNLIEDPYFGNNEFSLKWIEEKNWDYKTNFNIDKEILSNNFVEFDFQGLDTYAKIYINDEYVGQTDNMFRSWKYNVKRNLKLGKNTLAIKFESPILKNKEKVKKYPHKLPSGNETAEVENKVYSFTRKAAYHFGWDWGPRFVTAGIWKPIFMHIWNKIKIDNVHTYTKKLVSGKANLRTSINLIVEEAGDYILEIDGNKLSLNLKKGKQQINYDFEVDNPILWWTNGHGIPHLYQQKIKLHQANKLIEERNVSYGIRTIELINEPDEIGTSFYFKLNGEDLFMKGANYIPQDVFLPRVKPKDYAELIKSVKNANMNMLRVWGGGIYERDLFYDLCDKNGILVWQDFMFAGSLYPDHPEFINTVREEVKENVIRLRNHPCVAIWCGNNEIDVAWKNWGWQKQYGYNTQDSIKLRSDYLNLFHRLIPETLSDLDVSRPYTTTSPLSNWGTAENFNHESMHYWGVWHGKEPFENFEKNVGRFMSEYGFQSFPEMNTLRKVIASEDLHLESEVMKNRQKSYIGNGMISKHIEQYYSPPKSFEEFVALSQKVQAKGMQMAIESHKSKQPHCMGTLFWQLNDCWPGPSWSVIDYYGNKKDAYFEVKRSYKKKSVK